MIPPEIASFVHGGVAVVLATSDEQLRPHIGRAWGPLVDDDGEHLTLCADLPPGAEPEPGGGIAVTVSAPTTYRTVQLKGLIVACAAPGPDERARAAAHAESFAAETARVGLVGGRRMLRGELVAVTIAVREVFNQTPGPGAGMPL